MAEWTSQNPDFEKRVRASYGQQRMMASIGATLAHVGPGEVDIVLPFRDDLTQQHGFMHAGIITAIADTACGYAALSLMPTGTGVLSVEYKVNLMNPARGVRFIARGRVTKPGRTLTICLGEVFAQEGEQETLVAIMLATMMAIRDRPSVVD